MRKFLQKKGDCAIFYLHCCFFLNLLGYKDSIPRVLFICLFVCFTRISKLFSECQYSFFIMFMHAYDSYLIMKIFSIKDGKLLKPFIPCSYCVTFQGLRLFHSGLRH